MQTKIMCTGLSMVNGKLYYFESWGGAGYKGWKKSRRGNGTNLNEDGSVKTNEWFVHDKRTYHVDENGVNEHRTGRRLTERSTTSRAGAEPDSRAGKKSAEHGTI